MDASSAFTGPVLTFGITGEGVSFDPGTGLFSILTDSLGEGVTVSLAATDAEGKTVSRYTVTLNADAVPTPDPVPVPDEAPALVAAPVLDGTGRIGETVTLDPGSWSGTPAPALSVEWLLDGDVVAGATGLSYLPGAADDGRALAARVTASNAAGAAEAVTAPLGVTQVPPVAFATLPDLALLLGAAPWSFEAGGIFAGEALVFAVEGPGATIDAATGRLTLDAEAALDAAPVTVSASNSGGTARSGFRLSVAPARAPAEPAEPVPPVPGAPAPAGGLAALVLDQGSGVRTVSASALFSGEVAAYALEAAPEGVSIDAGAGLVSVETGRFLDEAVTVSATNAVGTTEQRFALAVRPAATDFAGAEALGALAFLSSGAAPDWREAEGCARLVPAAGTAAHGAWTGARGDGRYRCLARWSAEADSGTDSGAGFCFSARLTGNAAGDLAGIRLGLPRIGGVPKLELRQYAGKSAGSVRIALADADWRAEEWHWVELEVRDATVRARLYAETAGAPDWQVEGVVNRLEPGAFGPGALAGLGEAPAVDIKRLEYHPLTVQDVAQPAAPQDGDWDLEQFTERT